jgi:hypothetical protein
MKLKKVIRYIDEVALVRIWQVYSNGDEAEMVFEGYTDEIPWSLAECHLIEAEDNDYDKAIYPYVKENNKACIRITIGDEGYEGKKLRV